MDAVLPPDEGEAEATVVGLLLITVLPLVGTIAAILPSATEVDADATAVPVDGFDGVDG